MFLIGLYTSAVKYIDNDSTDVSDEVYVKRLAVCNSCELYNIMRNTCDNCGCFLHIKARWATEKCPIDKWSSEIAADQSQEPSSFQIQNSSEKSGGCGCGK